MTLQIDGFIVTGTPDEVNTFIKLYQVKQYTIVNYQQPIIPLYYSPDTDIKKWEITCKDSSNISSNINGSVVKPE